MKQSYLYIMATGYNGTLYIGVTSDLIKRVYEHRNGLIDGFSKKYAIHRLVYFEIHEDIAVAIQRESQMKAWKRAWKIELIEKNNPAWNDMYDTLF